MRTILFAFIFSMGLAALYAGMPNNSNEKAQILFSGAFSSDELPSGTENGGWWVVHRVGQNDHLSPASVKISRIPVVHEGSSEPDVSISLPELKEERILLLVRNFKGLSERILTTAKIFPQDNGRTKMEFKGHEMIVEQSPEGYHPEGYNLDFVYLGKRQTIAPLIEDEENHEPAGDWSVIWAGDLDNDGKPDLFIDYQYGWEDVHYLFLSSYALSGQIVQKVAEIDQPND